MRGLASHYNLQRNVSWRLYEMHRTSHLNVLRLGWGFILLMESLDKWPQKRCLYIHLYLYIHPYILIW